MEQIVANLSGKVRRETRNGRKFLVAPMSLIKEQVLDGSAGPLFYPGDEIEASADAWNGMPIINYHPVDESGKLTTARSAKDWHRAVIGNVFGVTYQKAKKRLRGEGWFDEELTQQIEPRVHAALLAGEKIELSTSFASALLEPAAEGAVHNGKPLRTARNYRPDHVAVLPDQTGACSVKDGCGVFNARRRRPMPKLLWQLAKLMRLVREEEAPETPEVPAKEPAKPDEQSVANELSHDRLREAISQALKARFTQDEPHCWVYEVFDEFFVYEQGGRLLRLGYSKSDAGVTLSGEPSEVVREINYIAAANSDAPEVGIMNKAQTVEWLVANCDCWKDGKAELEKLSDGQLAKLKSGAEKSAADKAAVANAAKPAETPTPANTPPAVSRQEFDALAGTLAAVNNSLAALVAQGEQSKAQAKQAMIGVLVGNIADEASRQAEAAVYEGMTETQLGFLLSKRGTPFVPQPSYLGAAGGAVFNAAAKSDADNLLLTADDADGIDEYASPRLRRKSAVA